MRLAWRMIALASVLTIGGLALGTSEATAQGYGYGGYPGYYQHGGGYHGGHHGGVYGVPAYGYYGQGGHDFAPHWHTRRTPFGGFGWYGTGRHDYRPHGHTVTPYGIESYNSWRTRSYSPPTPYVYYPW
ncbi:hypothetical protein [Tautonia sociabilis]|uniref:Uncharacterized protein n=1 Tax=Tautonia sociabilis TaxID=2080755 RepID=A0A432MI31_9BACT|nr:hypothetical protein [Tautonia sociabilis]RUL87024.1 hypothetical protein TsocGM_14620 [Tautonia sociabilis]